MFIDLFAIQPVINSDFGPKLISFQSEYLFEAESLSVSDYLPLEFLNEFAESLVPSGKIENGSKTILEPNSRLETLIYLELDGIIDALGDARSKVLAKYNANSRENMTMVKIQNYLEMMNSFLKMVSKDKLNVLVYTHNANPTKYQAISGDQNVYIERNDAESYGYTSINGASIDTIDIESGTIEGNVLWSDNIEGCDVDDRFVAQIMPNEINYKPLLIRPLDHNCLTDGYHFTLIPSFDAALESYVLPLVLKTYEMTYNKTKLENIQKLLTVLID